eukprot:augustus_masked-scaffold_15-processed-gene-6.62-mRNA-1 protein AED:0.04 eAED:0.04 QI:0/-1/0/1/-1/1/1/0/304
MTHSEATSQLTRRLSIGDVVVPKPPHPKWVNFALGGSAALCGWVIVHPFDLIKVRTQLLGKKASMAEVAKKVYGESGTRGFYAGLQAASIRQLTYGNLRLGIYASINDIFFPRREKGGKSAGSLGKLAMGLSAGAIASFLSNPIEISLVRMQSGSYGYKNVGEALYKVVRTEGVFALWNGAVPTVTRAMVVNAVQVGGYDIAKSKFTKLLKLEDGVPLHLISSVTAGFFNSLATLPLDTAKTRMQNTTEKTNMFRTIGGIIRHEGALSLWNGFIPYFARCAGHTVTMFLFLEQFKKVASHFYDN